LDALRVRERFKDFHDDDDETTSALFVALNGKQRFFLLILYLPSPTDDSQTGHGVERVAVGEKVDKLINLFRGLKAETDLERENRKTDITELKIEISHLKTRLTLEQEEISHLKTCFILNEDRNADKNLINEMRTSLAKEREDALGDMVELKQKLERQETKITNLESSLQQSNAELAKSIHQAKVRQHADMNSISEVLLCIDYFVYFNLQFIL
jgi:hypothetical protein